MVLLEHVQVGEIEVAFVHHFFDPIAEAKVFPREIEICKTKQINKMR